MATIVLSLGAVRALNWELRQPDPMFRQVLPYLGMSVRDELNIEGYKVKPLCAEWTVDPAEWTLFNMLLLLEASED